MVIAIDFRAAKRMERATKMLAPTGVILGLAGAAIIYWQSSSLWLGVFGLIMVSRFVMIGVPKIIFHKRRIVRTIFYLLWPLGGTAILYFTFQWWEIMWLSVLLGVVVGGIFSVLVSVVFFRRIVLEDQTLEAALGE